MANRQVNDRAGSAVAVPARTADPTLWWRWSSLLVVPVGVALIASVRGLRWEHLAAGILLLLLAQAGPAGRRFSWLAFPVLAVGLLYDLFALALPLQGEIHVADLHAAELALFGVTTPAGVVTPAEWLQARHLAAVDLVAGFAYLAYLFQVFAVALWLWFRDQGAMARLAWGFLVVNVIGMAIWIAWPAAPPWYVAEHGLGPADLGAAPSAAGAAHFDALLGITYFEDFYARNVNVFGAMPSLHVAYPTLVMLATWSRGAAWRWATGVFALLVGFSAVYLGHHYVLDVAAGVAVGGVGWWIVVAARRRLAAAPDRGEPA